MPMSVAESKIATRHGGISVWQSAGSRFPVLMIHGTGASKKVFRHQFSSPLADRLRLIAIDLPGHGDSDDAPAADGYSLPNLAATVSEIVDTLQLQHTVVYGWSLGGHIAIELMSFHAAVSGVMLTGAPPLPRGPIGMFRGFHAGWDMLLASKAAFTERDAERFGHMCFGDSAPPEFLDDIRRSDGRCRAQFSRSMLRGEGADQRRVIETSRVPVAFVNGEHEKILRLSYLNGLRCPTLWEGQSHLVEGAAHSPFFQQPDAFNALLGRFADDVAAAVANAPLLSVRRAS